MSPFLNVERAVKDIYRQLVRDVEAFEKKLSLYTQPIGEKTIAVFMRAKLSDTEDVDARKSLYEEAVELKRRATYLATVFGKKLGKKEKENVNEIISWLNTVIDMLGGGNEDTGAEEKHKG